MMATKKLGLVIVLAFFNYEDVRLTLDSLLKQKNKNSFDVVILENRSKYTKEMESLINSYSNIKQYFRSDENCDGQIIHSYINTNSSSLKQYDYVSVTEGDVILEEGAYDEAIYLLEKYKNVGNVSIDLNLKNLTIPPLPESARGWVPTPIVEKDHLIGPTGFQFIAFRTQFLLQFIDALNEKKICGKIALGVDNFYGISDSNLISFNNLMKTPWIRTKEKKLLHIGWEHYKDPKDEYVLQRNKRQANNKFRINVDLTKVVLKQIF